MTSRRRSTVLAAVAALSFVVLTGCTGDADESDDGGGAGAVTVGAQSASVQLVQGEVLVVELGEINGGVGSTWDLVAEPDAAVLGPGRRVSTSVGDEDPPPPGTPSALAYHLEAVGPGATTIEFRYSLRGELTDPPSGPGQVVIEVTVD